MQINTWSIELLGESLDLKCLSDRFKNENYFISAHAEGYRLNSSIFEDSMDISVVQAKSIELINSMNGAMALEYDNWIPIRFGSIYSKDDGRQSVTILLEPIKLRTRVMGDLTVCNSNGTQNTEIKPLSLKAVEKSENNRSIQKVLRLYGFQSKSWETLYKIYEVIKEDTDKNIPESWASSAEISNFTGTANNSNIIGDNARHGHSGFKSFKNPLSHKQAKNLIKRLIKHWIENNEKPYH